MRAVVTGASNGIGREIAVVLAEQGWELVLVARSADKMRELASQLKTPATIIACDLSLESSCRELHQQLAGTPVDLLVNNKMIARGEVVEIDGKYGVRILEIVK